MLRRLALAVLTAPWLAHAEPTGAPAYLIELPPAVTTVLVAETATSTLLRFENGPDGIKLADRSYISIGESGVGKERAWDRRTPLGIYFISEQLDTSKLHEKYGPIAFPLDYPNPWDRRNERSGDGIWIHGVAPNGGKRPALDTDGCIALPNDNLLALADWLEPNVTPVLVTRLVKWGERDEIAAIRNELRARIDAWAESQQLGDLHHYFGLYAGDFGYRGMSRDEWQAFRTQAFGATPLQRVELGDLTLLADPEEDGLYLSRFELRFIDDERTVRTTKRLYWRRSDRGVLEIVAEDNG